MPQLNDPCIVAARPGLLDLPFELKQQIFRPLLKASSDINIGTGDLPEWWTRVDTIDPSILHVCRALRDVASTILYQENDFRFSRPMEAHRFAKLENAEQARSFAFVIDGSAVAKWHTYLEGETPVFSFKQDFLQVIDLCLIFTRMDMDMLPGSERDVFWEYQKMRFCGTLIHKIRVYRWFNIGDVDILRFVPHGSSRLEGCVRRAMEGDREFFEEYRWELNWALQHLFVGAKAEVVQWKE